MTRAKLYGWTAVGFIAYSLLVAGLAWREGAQADAEARLDAQTGAALRASAQAGRNLLAMASRSKQADRELARLRRQADNAATEAAAARQAAVGLRDSLGRLGTGSDSLPVLVQLVGEQARELTALRLARLDDSTAFGVLLEDRDRWKGLALQDAAVRDSLRAALEAEHAARVCHMLGLSFMPRCLSRTATAVVTAVVTAGSVLLVTAR